MLREMLILELDLNISEHEVDIRCNNGRTKEVI